jgi:two-component system cell cycle response regulator
LRITARICEGVPASRRAAPRIHAMVTSSDILRARILLVDDRRDNLDLLEFALRAAGYTHVSSTQDPHEVGTLHAAQSYDLILLDLQMPGMDGFDVMEELKGIEKDSYLPVLAITAQPSHKVRALKACAKDFISKPFDMDEVLMRVHNMLEVRLLHDEACKHAKLLESLALKDPLTGLANRRLLPERVWMAIAHARRNKSAMAVIYLDLDGFKDINDTLGHAAGDQLLKMVADRLVAAVREEDTVARLGGDEFMIALWHVDRHRRHFEGRRKADQHRFETVRYRRPRRHDHDQRGRKHLPRSRRGCRQPHEKRGFRAVRSEARGQEYLSAVGN